MEREKVSEISIRKNAEEGQVGVRRLVLQGAFTHEKTAWKRPNYKLLVFVSSTFTDTQVERNYLMDVLLFSLRKQAQEYEIQVIFADMRW
jgi:hypothetical protein